MRLTRTAPVQFCTALAAALSVAAGPNPNRPPLPLTTGSGRPSQHSRAAGLRKKANQIDYQHRILQWFGQYLRNEPAPAWITSGVSVLEREQELKRVSKKGS